MKKTVFFASLIILSLSASATSVKTSLNAEKDKIAVPDKKENKLSEEEINRLTKRIEEIRDMDKSSLRPEEKRELRKELKGIKENIRRDGGYIYIGGGTLLLIIILLIILL